MQLDHASRLRVDRERVTAHCGRHVVSLDRKGRIEPAEDGYYFHQTRFLSRFELRVRDQEIKPVCCVNTEPHATVTYFLAPSPAGRKAAPPGDDNPSGGEVVKKAIEFQIDAFVGGGWRQAIHLTNRGLARAEVVLDLLYDADFADQQEVTTGERQQNAEVRRSFTASAGHGELMFAYQHPDLNHKTRIRITAPGTLADDGTWVSATLRLGPQESARIEVDVVPSFLGEAMAPWFGFDGAPTSNYEAFGKRQEWLSQCTDFEPANPQVKAVWTRAATDLWALQSLDGEGESIFTPLGGIPKYTGLFGRDSLVAGLQSTFLNRSTLRGGLLDIGEWTAKEVDDRYDAQPGKVLHQRQLGPLALLGKTAFIHYYGDYSAPAYYLIGAANDFAESGDAQVFESIRGKVEATLAWMDRDGDIDNDGFYEYLTRAGKLGIKNQGWKDSSQAILYPDGSYVRDPIAVVEIQGLFYAAKQAIAAVYHAIGEREQAARLFDQAAALKKRFNERYWMPDLKFYALALDPDKNQVRTIASNPSLCLACGIVDDDKAPHVVDRLMAPDMFSGWGVRTLSSEHPAFNPLAYHLGSVWPVSNAHVCSGFKRYGFDEALHRVARALFDAARLFDFERLPEVFGGYARGARWTHPGIYPDACSPQAWSASAVIQICQMLTGVFPLAPLRTLVLDPALPDWMPEVTIRDLRVGDECVSLALHREADGQTRHEILSGGTGLRVLRLEPGEGQDRFELAMTRAAA